MDDIYGRLMKFELNYISVMIKLVEIIIITNSILYIGAYWYYLILCKE
jgi:hypothetical protein